MKLNIGSGQRYLKGWVNCDIATRPPDQVPDIEMDALKPWPFDDGSVDVVLFHQVYEHFHLSDGTVALKQAYRVLREGGRLVVTVPDLRALCRRWMARQIDDYIFCVNLHGAYQGLPGDDHHWSWSFETLRQEIHSSAEWTSVHAYDYKDREAVRDWWTLGIEAMK